MGSDDYSSAIGGGLKLKGGKPAGVVKKKKKDKSKEKDTFKESDPKVPALQRALADEEQAARTEAEKEKGREAGGEQNQDVDLEEEDYDAGNNKTEAERNYDEMRRKRVSVFCIFIPSLCFVPLLTQAPSPRQSCEWRANGF